MSLKLSEYPELEKLWYNPDGNKIFCNLKNLVVYKCDFLSDVLFSSNLQQLLHTLETLEVRDCHSLKVVFDVKVMDDEEVSNLNKLTLVGLQNLKHIWNKNSQRALSFGKLLVLRVGECQNLMNLFSVSQCQDLRQLRELNIENCGVEEIVANEKEREELILKFPELTMLRLVNLTKLKSFYQGRHTLECPSLKTLDVYLCEALQMFSFDSQQKNEVDMPIQHALFFVKKVHIYIYALFSISLSLS